MELMRTAANISIFFFWPEVCHRVSEEEFITTVVGVHSLWPKQSSHQLAVSAVLSTGSPVSQSPGREGG